LVKYQIKYKKGAKNMIKHIVMWRLKEHAENRTKEENANVIKDLLEGLINKIKEIKKLEVGINFNKNEYAYDLALYSEFDDENSLEKYIDHPEHKKAAEFLSKVRIDRVIVDYKI
jgi:hypothetical protein